MSWEVSIGEFERNITFNFSLLFRIMMPGGLGSLHGCTAEEAATIIWHGFRVYSSIEDGQHVVSVTGPSPLVRGTNTVEQGLDVLRELWEACIEAEATEKVLVFG